MCTARAKDAPVKAGIMGKNVVGTSKDGFEKWPQFAKSWLLVNVRPRYSVYTCEDKIAARWANEEMVG